MNEYVNYLIESGVSIAAFTLLYLIFLRHETYFRMNRWFMLAGICFSLLLPLIHIRILKPKAVVLDPITVTPYRNLLETVSVYGNNVSTHAAHFMASRNWILVVYFLVLLFLLSRLFLQFLSLMRYIRKGDKFRIQQQTFIFTEQNCSPFSFLSYVFVPRNWREIPGWEKMVAHELGHIQQRHSIDRVFAELITIVQWFNPMCWIMRRLISENHEYLADQSVLRKDKDVVGYQQILLNSFRGMNFSVANHLNYSMTKKRLKMMTRLKSNKLSRIKLGSGIVLAMLLILLFAFDARSVGYEMTEQAPDQKALVANNDFTQSKTIQIPVNEVPLSSDDSTKTYKQVSEESIQGKSPVTVVGFRSSRVQKTSNELKSEKTVKATSEETIPITRMKRTSDSDSLVSANLKVTFKNDSIAFSGSPMAIRRLSSLIKGRSVMLGDTLLLVSSRSSNMTPPPLADPKTNYNSETQVFFMVEDMPEYPGGEKGLREYIAKAIRYPVDAQKRQVEGTVYVSFVVNADGSVGDTKVVRGVDEVLDKEAIRVVKSLPRWKPGKQKGKPVRVSFTVPIKFVLQ